MEIAEQYSEQIKLDENKIDSRFDEIKNEFEKLTHHTEDLYSSHPFKVAIDSSREIYYENDYIHIRREKNKLSEGDIRISFHQIEDLADVTLFAAANSFQKEIESCKKNDILGTLNLYKGGMLGWDVSATVTDSNNKKRVVKIGKIGFLLKGIIPQ